MKAWLGRFLFALVVLLLIGAGGAFFYMENGLRADLLARAAKPLGTSVEAGLFFPAFDPRDKAAPRVEIALTPVARGLTHPTDIEFLPPPFDSMVVTEQSGRVTRVDLKTGAAARWIDVDVHHDGPGHGLLSLAIHPGFADNGRIFLSYTVAEGGDTESLISEFRVPEPKSGRDETPFFERHLMRVPLRPTEQGGGCLRFGPDGMLYIGWSDGGAPGDPSKHGQNGKTWLGSILRIDVNGEEPPLAYRIPADNPLRSREDMAPETFAFGVRNPGRFTWDQAGRMIVADVGQERWQELNFALPGENLGWNRMEGRVCFDSEDCDPAGMRQPFRVYPHTQGTNIVAGFVSEAPEPAGLRGLLVYGDRASGRLWAVKVPDDTNARSRTPKLLGAWPIEPSTFGRDRTGRVYVADYARGVVFRFDDRPR